jgi:hypothetical protein
MWRSGGGLLGGGPDAHERNELTISWRTCFQCIYGIKVGNIDGKAAQKGTRGIAYGRLREGDLLQVESWQLTISLELYM